MLAEANAFQQLNSFWLCALIKFNRTTQISKEMENASQMELDLSLHDLRPMYRKDSETCRAVPFKLELAVQREY